MPIKIYRNFKLEKLLILLEQDEIQLLLIPDNQVNFYTISMDSDDYIITEGFGEDGSMHEWDREKILKKLGDRKLYQSIVATSGMEMGILMDRYEKKFKSN